jgi:hypothetical protein
MEGDLASISETLVDVQNFWDVPTDLQLSEFMQDLYSCTLHGWFNVCNIDAANTSHYPTDSDLCREIDLLNIDAFGTSSTDLSLLDLVNTEEFKSAVERYADIIDVESDSEVEIWGDDSDDDSGDEYIPIRESPKAVQRELRKMWTRKPLRSAERTFMMKFHRITIHFNAAVPIVVLRTLWHGTETSLERFVKSNRRYISSNGGRYCLTREGKNRFKAF